MNSCIVYHNDCLQAMDSLLDSYNTRFKLVYLDPPYRTNKVFRNFDDRMKLEVWQEFIRIRAERAYELLTDDGYLFCQLDTNSVHYAAIILEELFGTENVKPTIVWKRSRSRNSLSKDICKMNDFLLWYSKSSEACINKLPHDEEYLRKIYRKNDNDGRGRYNLVNLFNNGNTAAARIRIFPNDTHPFWEKNPDVAFLAGTSYEARWFCSQKTLQKHFDENTVAITLKHGRISVVYKKDYLSTKNGKTPTTWWDDCGTNNDAHTELCEIFNTQHKVFETPKPLKLMERIIHLTTNENDWILDPFGGSGTTAQAGLQMNRNVVICESMVDNVNIITERIDKTINNCEFMVI